MTSKVLWDIVVSFVFTTVIGSNDADGLQSAERTAFGCTVFARYEVFPSSKIVSPNGLCTMKVYSFLLTIGAAKIYDRGPRRVVVAGGQVLVRRDCTVRQLRYVLGV